MLADVLDNGIHNQEQDAQRQEAADGVMITDMGL